MTKRKFLGANPDLVARLRFTDQEGALKEIIEVVDDLGGDVQKVAKKLGVAKRTMYLWCNDYPELRTAIDRARKRRIKEHEE